MIVIDKLCYQSGLRHVNAGEKFAFAMITLLLCVVSRSIACACIVLAATGILTVWKGGIPVFRYLKLMTVPLASMSRNRLHRNCACGWVLARRAAKRLAGSRSFNSAATSSASLPALGT